MTTSHNEPNERAFYRLNVHVWCTPEQLAELESAVANVLCPDLDHDGPCPIPWEIEAHGEQAADVPNDILAEIRNAHPDVDPLG